MLKIPNHRKSIALPALPVLWAATAGLGLQSCDQADDPAPSAETTNTTPSDWQQIEPVNPELDFSKTYKTLAQSSAEQIPTPDGWEKVDRKPTATKATQSILPPPVQDSPPTPTPNPTPNPSPRPADQAASPPEPDPPAVATVENRASADRHFPTEQRVWTNYQGQLMVASVIECDFETGSLLMESDDGILRNYQLSQLSDSDRAYLWGLAEGEGARDKD